MQGLGAGAVQPMGMTIVGDIYSLAERAKVQGYIASVWAISSLVGPTLGGVFADYLSWRWIFLVNLPLGLRRRVDAVAPVRREASSAPRQPPSTCVGALLLATGGTLLLLAPARGRRALGLGRRRPSIGLLVARCCCSSAFVAVERRARRAGAAAVGVPAAAC